MTIIGFIIGYYRTGTTIFQRIYKYLNPDVLVLSEPTQHEIVSHIISEGCKKEHSLHGWKVFEDYCKLPLNILLDFFVEHFKTFYNDNLNKGIITNYYKARYILDIFHYIPQKVVIKSTQLWLYVKKLIDDYNAWVLLIERDIPHIVADHLDYFTAIDLRKLKEILLDGVKPISFYCDDVFMNLLRVLGIDKVNIAYPIDKLVFNSKVYQIAIDWFRKNVKNIYIINFDRFIMNPYKWFDKLPFQVTEDSLKLLDATKINPVHQFLRDWVRDSLNRINIDEEKIKKKLKELNSI